MPYLLPSHDNGQVHVLHRLHTEETAGEPLEISARHPTDVCSTVGHAKGIGVDIIWAEADCGDDCCPSHHRVSLCS